MRLCRFELEGSARIGRIEGDLVHIHRGEFPGSHAPTGETCRLDAVRLLAPVLPGKIIGIGRNYAAHAAELGNVPPEAEPLIFLKPPSAVLDPGLPIVLPGASSRVDHEGELGVVIGCRARNIGPEADPLEYVLGYTCVNDVTARDLQKKDVQFTRAKGFDTFCPLGPWLETELEIASLGLETRVNGDVRQKGSTAEMIFSVARLLRFLSGIMTLHPGDLVATGTPSGVGPLEEGDVVEIEVEGIGILRNPVRR